MPKYFPPLFTVAFTLSVSWAGSTIAAEPADHESEAMDTNAMTYVEARISEGCHLKTRQDGSQSVVGRNQCEETLRSLEEELNDVDAFAHELEEVQEFRKTFNF